MPSLNLRNPLRRDPNRLTIKQRAAALKATAARVMRREKPETIAEALERMGPHWPGCVPYPTHQPKALVAIKSVLQMEADRLLSIAQAEFARLYAAGSADLDEPGRHNLAARLRSELRIDALTAAADPERGKGEAYADPIFAAIAASRAAQAAMDFWNKRFNAEGKLTEADFAEENRLDKALYETQDAVIATVPTTVAGRLALLEHLRWQMGLYGMADGQPPEADSPFWRDAYKALKAALAFEGEAKRGAPLHPATTTARDLSKEAYDYAHGLDLASVPFSNLWRMYEAFAAASDLLQPVTDEEMFNEKPDDPALWYTPGGYILDAEVNRLSCLRDAMAGELERRKPDDAGQRDARLEVLISHEIRCEGRIHNAALLAEINAAWGA